MENRSVNSSSESLYPSDTTNSIKYAGFGKRLLAYLVDTLILFPVALTLQSLMGQNNFAIFNVNTLQELEKIQQSGNSTLSTIVNLVLGVGFIVSMWVNYDGATPGKKLMGIKIVKSDGSKVTYPTAIIRYVGYLISAFVLGLGYIWIIWDNKKQAWHDKISDTIVIETDRKPRTLLAVLLSLLSVAFFVTYMGALMYKGYILGMKEAQKSSAGSEGIKLSTDNMTGEARVHYDKSQELFKILSSGKLTDLKSIQTAANQTIVEAKLATDIEPNNALLWSSLGDAYTWNNTIGTLEDSLDAYKKAAELDPQNVIYSNYVGDALIRLQRYEDAILQFQKSFRITDDSGFAHLSAGKAYKALEIYDQAKIHLERAIQIFQKYNDKGQFDNEILEAQKEIGGLLLK